MAEPSWIAVLTAQLIPIYAPLLLAGIKKLSLGNIPGVLLPGLAIALGMGTEALIAWLAGRAPDPLWGGVYGALGVVVRDTWDQLRKLLQRVS